MGQGGRLRRAHSVAWLSKLSAACTSSWLQTFSEPSSLHSPPSGKCGQGSAAPATLGIPRQDEWNIREWGLCDRHIDPA